MRDDEIMDDLIRKRIADAERAAKAWGEQLQHAVLNAVNPEPISFFKVPE
jgi:hypothetical protein